MNTTKLNLKDIEWADYIFISAMVIQKDSVHKVTKLCKSMKKKIVAGGPLFTADYQEFDDVDHLALNEAENTLEPFLLDIENGCARHIYSSSEYPVITKTPVPLWNLLNMKKYFSMSIQYSRGCPFGCEFCNVVVLNGHTRQQQHVAAHPGRIGITVERDPRFHARGELPRVDRLQEWVRLNAHRTKSSGLGCRCAGHNAP